MSESTIPDFESDVFISYAHVDDEQAGVGKPFVSELHRYIEKRGPQILGRPIVVWRDGRLQGNDVIDEALAERIAKSAVFVGVLSPPFLASEWCRWELECFLGRRSDDLEAMSQVPIFKVLKRPVERTSEPQPLDRVRGYSFYEVSEAEGRTREFLLQPDSEVEFYLRADELVADIARIVESMESGLPSSRGTVYLATASSDMNPYRDDLRRELTRRGYTVAPPENAAIPSDELSVEIERRVVDAEVCIHLVGNRYSLVPEGEQRSLCRLQLDATRQVADSSSLRRFVWVAPDASEAHARQAKLRRRLLDGLESGSASEIIGCSWDDFKSHLVHSLESTPAPPPASKGSKARVYVACPPEEIEHAHRFADWLEERGVSAAVPMRSGTEAEQRDVENDELAASDAVMLLWRDAPEYWVRNRLMMVRKASASREHPIDSVAVVRLGDVDRSFRTPDATIIDASDGTFDAVGEFVAAIRST